MEKYKEPIIYLALVIVLAVFMFQKVSPLVTQAINTFNNIKTQKDVNSSIQQQLQVAREKVERKNKMRLGEDMTKKIYEPTGAAVDSESNFAVLLDDIIEISRKNNIKTHSIQYTYNPPEDIFVKGDAAHYSACKLDMKIVSDYTDFEGFLQDLYKYNYLVNLNNIEIYPYAKNKRILLINFSITLYTAKVEGADAATTPADGASADPNAAPADPNAPQDPNAAAVPPPAP